MMLAACLIQGKFQGPPIAGPPATHTTGPMPLPIQNPLKYGNGLRSLWEGGRTMRVTCKNQYGKSGNLEAPLGVPVKIPKHY